MSLPRNPFAPTRRAALLVAALALPLAACSSTGAAPTSAPTSASAPATSVSAPATSVSAPATSASPSASPSASSASPTPTPTKAGYTMADVQKHASATSCWTVINKNVYDVTKWINKHPGGRARILQLCGKDGTAAYRGEHGSESRPAGVLADYKLGPLS